MKLNYYYYYSVVVIDCNFSFRLTGLDSFLEVSNKCKYFLVFFFTIIINLFFTFISHTTPYDLSMSLQYLSESIFAIKENLIAPLIEFLSIANSECKIRANFGVSSKVHNRNTTLLQDF